MSDKKNEKKHKKYYLVDYENVHKTGLNGIDELEKHDNVIIFYSQHADKLPFSLHSQIIETKANITYFEVDTVGKNALDFQLSSYIGYVLGKHPKCICYIISKDNGYENVCNFWRKYSRKICLVPDISQCKKFTALKKSDIKAVLTEQGLEKEDIEFVKNLVMENAERYDIPVPKIKCLINQELCRRFGGEKTKEIYASVKQFIK
ncbi:MAG: PIN domain-containing protein [Prevotella sp.]|nr:PIN domain-containing protein [Alistipes senegalensis]MCM1358013.1 PIN domain-containing protein [Prevotella sp.]MCM1474463.1 PIN domain-containing protein [Muribaculaceae bacterium]